MRAAAISTAILAAAVAAPAVAQDYPERPITILVGFGPGGGSDLMARAIASAIEETSGWRFQIENKPGGAGLVAAVDALARPADGYTILQATDGIVSAIASGEIDGAFGDEIAPICLTQSTFSQLYVRADDDRLHDLSDVVEQAKSDRVVMANTGRPGTMEYILGAGLAAAVGGTIEQINFDNPAERYAALLGGQVDVLLEQPGDVRPYVDAGQFKPILTFLDERPSAAPGVPSLTDAGFDAIPPIERVRGLFARGDVPDRILAKLGAACETAYASEAYLAFNAEQFMDPDRSLRVGDEALSFLRDLQAVYSGAEVATQ